MSKIVECDVCGLVARDILVQSAGTEAEIGAVNPRSFYVLSENGLVCFGAASIGNGPINVLAPDLGFPPDLMNAGVYPEAKCFIDASEISIGDALTFGFGDALTWRPPEWPMPAPIWVGARQLLRDAISNTAPIEGLSRLVLRPEGAASLIERAAQVPIETVIARLPEILRKRESDRGLSDALTLLIGLGPGLTPSGDDLIGGILVALTAVRQRGVRDQIWDAIGPELDMLTVPVSAMHLAVAADGLAAEALHDVVRMVLADDRKRLPTAIGRAATIGATSGWDGMAGALLVLEASNLQS